MIYMKLDELGKHLYLNWSRKLNSVRLKLNVFQVRPISCRSFNCNQGTCYDNTTIPYCVCNDGWSNPDCTLAICNGGCVNGNCTAPNTCVCNAGWSGNDCSNGGIWAGVGIALIVIFCIVPGIVIAIYWNMKKKQKVNKNLEKIKSKIIIIITITLKFSI